MKKTIKFLAILLLTIMMFFPMNKVWAASLDTLTVDVSSTLVRPGEEVTLTINFGESLGAYTFDIAYDSNIFEYVSVSEGTVNVTSNNVRVTFYDSIKPSSSMSIVFKANSDITTSNPTELMVTAEGLANADASATYDDILTPITKNITVEPEYQDYEISLEYTGSIIAGEEKEMVLSYYSNIGRYYANARLVAEATTPDGANVKLTGIDENGGEEDIIQSGWGDSQGYEIGGENFSQVLNVTALFTDVGNYTITLKLIDRSDSDGVIAEKTFSFTVAEAASQGSTDETTDEETTTEETTETEESTTEEQPTLLPKTGINIYVPLTILIISLAGFVVYYNRKNQK